MKYYFIGIKGSGMSTLANILHDLGHSVIGYDDSTGYKFTMEGLEKRGIEIYTGENYPELSSDTVVTYTAAINESHHEVSRVKELGLEVVPYQTLMGMLTKNKETTCVCGTHGKTSTSLMIANILHNSLGCSYFVGDGSGYGNKDSNLLVMESCEYNRHFLSYYPHNTVITNIELDHTETYPNIEVMINAYQEFCNKTENFIVACGDDLNIRTLTSDKKIYYYGFKENNDLIVKNRLVLNGKTCFDVYYNNNLFDHYEVNLFGDHMIQDMLAAIMIGILYDVSKDIIKNTLEKFQPAKRRFNEIIVKDNVVVDDYAHHPTEIKVTYDAAHQKYPNKEIIAIFLPNTYSRTMDLFDDFCSALSLYDKAYLMDISCDRERKEDYPFISSEKITQNVLNSEMISLETIDKLKKHHNSVLCFMSCANISKMINKYLEINNEE